MNKYAYELGRKIAFENPAMIQELIAKLTGAGHDFMEGGRGLASKLHGLPEELRNARVSTPDGFDATDVPMGFLDALKKSHTQGNLRGAYGDLKQMAPVGAAGAGALGLGGYGAYQGLKDEPNKIDALRTQLGI